MNKKCTHQWFEIQKLYKKGRTAKDLGKRGIQLICAMCRAQQELWEK